MANSEAIAGFRDVKREILARIHRGQWAQGALIPNETDLAGEFNCARATVNRALTELADEGIVDRKRRAGTRVAANRARKAKFEIPIVRLEVEALSATYRYALVMREEIAAPGWLAARWDVPGAAPVLHLQCMHFADNFPYQFEDRWINTATVPHAQGADFRAVGPNEWLVREVPLTDGEISFQALAADAETARHLSVAAGQAVFVAERITRLHDRPVTLARMFHRPGYRMITRF